MDYVNQVGRMIDQEKAYVRARFPFSSPSVTCLIISLILLYRLPTLYEEVCRHVLQIECFDVFEGNRLSLTHCIMSRD